MADQVDVRTYNNTLNELFSYDHKLLWDGPKINENSQPRPWRYGGPSSALMYPLPYYRCIIQYESIGSFNKAIGLTKLEKRPQLLVWPTPLEGPPDTIRIHTERAFQSVVIEDTGDMVTIGFAERPEKGWGAFELPPGFSLGEVRNDRRRPIQALTHDLLSFIGKDRVRMRRETGLQYRAYVYYGREKKRMSAGILLLPPGRECKVLIAPGNRLTRSDSTKFRQQSTRGLPPGSFDFYG